MNSFKLFKIGLIIFTERSTDRLYVATPRVNKEEEERVLDWGED